MTEKQIWGEMDCGGPARKILGLSFATWTFLFLAGTSMAWLHWFRQLRYGSLLETTWNLNPASTTPLTRTLITMSEYPPLNGAINETMKNNRGWELKIFTVEDAESFMVQHCPKYAPAFTGLIPIALKADVFRACALWAVGGVWFDDDLVVESLDDTLAQLSGAVLLVHDAPQWSSLIPFPGFVLETAVWNAFMVARQARQPVFKCVLENALTIVLERRHVHPFRIAGPRAFDGCLKRSDDIRVFGILMGGKARPWRSTTIVATHTRLAKRRPVPYYGVTEELFELGKQ